MKKTTTKTETKASQKIMRMKTNEITATRTKFKQNAISFQVLIHNLFFFFFATLSPLQETSSMAQQIEDIKKHLEYQTDVKKASPTKQKVCKINFQHHNTHAHTHTHTHTHLDRILFSLCLFCSHLSMKIECVFAVGRNKNFAIFVVVRGASMLACAYA